MRFFILVALFLLPISSFANQPNTTGQLLSWFGSTVFILLIIFLLAYFLKKTPLVKKNKQGDLMIENSLFLGPKSKILQIKAGSKTILVGVTPQNINYLCEIKDDIDFESYLAQEKTEQVDNKVK